MANKVNKDVFNRLKKLNPKRRMELAHGPLGQSYLGLLTPTQFAELFPRYYERGMPDVSGFRSAISKMSQEKQQKYLDGLEQRIGGDTGRSREASVKNPVRVKEIYDYLMTKPGMDHAHAMGIVNNLYHESKFDSGAIGDGGTSGGLFQHHNERFSAMKSYVGGDWQSNWKRQIDYAMTESDMKNYMSSRYGDERAASVGFTQTFERPANTVSTSFSRAETMGSMLNIVKTGGGGGGSVQDSDYVSNASGGNFNGRGFMGLSGKYQCVQYARSAGGLSHTSNWTPGQKATGGGLKPGDWIARFNSDGSYGNRYGYSHVARFEGYVRDKQGNITGMQVTHQYGHTPVHSAIIPVGNDKSEFDANNYHQIHDRGRPASMHSTDGTDEKVKTRVDYFKQNQSALEPETTEGTPTTAKVAAVQEAPPPPMPHPAAYASAEQPTATVEKGSSAEFLVQREKAKLAGTRDSTANLPKYAQADMGVMNDATAKVSSPKAAPVDMAGMRGRIENIYGKSMSDREYDMLIRATHAESSAKKHVPEEHAMIMGTILNRAKNHKGGIEGALMARYQFESVTGRTRGRFSPNPAYKAGPSERRLQSLYDAVMNHLHNVPQNQLYFTSERGDKSKWHAKMVKMGGDVQGGTRFGTKLGAGDYQSPEQKTQLAAVPQATTPPGQAPQFAVGESVPQSTTQIIQNTIYPKAAAGEGQHKPVPAVPGKPGEKTPVTPSAPASVTTSSPPPPPAPAPVTTPNESSTQNFLKSQGVGVPGASQGGTFDVGGPSKVNFYPMDKKDNMAAIKVDPRTNQPVSSPLFTAHTGESISVSPNQKVNGNGMGPSVNPMAGQLDALREQMASAMSSAGQAPKVEMKQGTSPRSDMPNFIDNLNKQNRDKAYHNPAFERAMVRTRGGESGDTLNNHFSSDNTNG